jgi:hypothetical protein
MFFDSFVIVVSYVMINLFVAVIVEQFGEVSGAVCWAVCWCGGDGAC